MIKKVLIANRGEIALRIVRACNELGIKTLAVYSEADEQSLHVQLADEAICIGPAVSSQSYLKADRIIAAAEIANVDAIHPGYGFLAENADFAEQCSDCKIKFIGPSSDAIVNFGDKAKAREMASKAKVPVIPGSEGIVDNEKKALSVAKKIGFPVIIKAVAGGGGKGMRAAHNAVAFAKEYNSARNEAEKAFGNGDVYIEKFLEAPRHIEIQVLGDQYGNVIHLGERDCSVQRRHQKLIEEAPSPFISDDTRKKMGRDAVKLAKSVKYEGAGTVEFLVDDEQNYYFIEMNTRIQVEHGVTEEVTGVDLVKEQLLIASGEKLNYEQKDIKFTRHAIECRVCAEDPSRNFAPCPGEISVYYSPGGHGVRIDSHVYGGYTIPPHYDSMISKVITYGRNRELALDRMDRALKEYIIRGIASNISFSRAIIKDPTFRSGKATTKYIEEFLKRAPKNLYS
ncbi:MAG: acetyl-CoA carboxylase biotin carboxylase subunit [Puniceicoccaceae bacterium MED-G32]|jgi:acetyl-CoA carboxylase biotin carboxylase subunit|nr:MAG: acetyl-CoA carboxylase biotin carboxylase subunit [Puniceicoccaceae bacterium MED-G32]|tara:strand:+ start:10736 stop:12100 length:1365 start_codon:yes stop_codon:yes gene_type:complete